MKTYFLQLTLMEIEKKNQVSHPPPPGTKKILLHTVVVLHYRHHIQMAFLVPGGVGGEAVKILENEL